MVTQRASLRQRQDYPDYGAYQLGRPVYAILNPRLCPRCSVRSYQK